MHFKFCNFAEKILVNIFFVLGFEKFFNVLEIEKKKNFI